MSSLQRTIVTFLKGEIWLHNANDIYNNFYGKQFDRRITVVAAGSNPSAEKDWLYLYLEDTDGDWSAVISNEKGQASELLAVDFEKLGSDTRADFLRDSNTPNVDNPVLNGDFLKSKEITIELIDSSTEYSKIFAVGVYYNQSETTNR